MKLDLEQADVNKKPVIKAENATQHSTSPTPSLTLLLAMEGRKEIFNDALNTFYLRLNGKGPLRKRERKPASATWATLYE